MPTNFYMFFIAAIIPMIVGAIYYSPMVAGKSWMNVNDFQAEDLRSGNMFAIYGGAYLLSVVAAFALSGIVIHQTAVVQLGVPEIFDKGSPEYLQLVEYMKVFGNTHRTFSHGALHGGIIAIFFVLPIIGINALFERRGFKYVFIHLGYWFITLLLMGGLLCSTLKYPAV